MLVGAPFLTLPPRTRGFMRLIRTIDGVTKVLMVVGAVWAFFLCFFILADIIARAMMSARMKKHRKNAQTAPTTMRTLVTPSMVRIRRMKPRVRGGRVRKGAPTNIGQDAMGQWWRYWIGYRTGQSYSLASARSSTRFRTSLAGNPCASRSAAKV